MKTLYLLRHAKSSWDDESLDDEDRPLTKRGKRDCQLVSNELARSGRSFKQVFCSSARRTQDTLRRFKAESPVFDSSQITVDEGLYTFDMQTLLDWLKNLPHDIDQALIIGHNPALIDLANFLYDGKIGHFGTCTFVELEVNVEYWDQLRSDSAKLIEIVRPKQLR